MLLKNNDLQKLKEIRNELNKKERQEYIDLVESTKQDLKCSYKKAKVIVKDYLKRKKKEKIFSNSFIE